MASGPYSFIDIAVNDAIRRRFAAGDALIVLDTELAHVIWANGAGAALLGHPDIEAVMGAAADLPLPARRQMAAVPGFPHPARDMSLILRLGGRAVAASLSAIVLPDGLRGLVLAVAAPQAKEGDADEIARRAVAGFAPEAGFFAAMLDAQGAVMAATSGFDALGLTADVLASLVAEVGGERDRLVKRLVPVGSGRLPAAIARLDDAPALHLLVAVDDVEPASNIVHLAAQPTPDDQHAAQAKDRDEQVRTAGETQSEEAPAGALVADADHWYFNPAGEAGTGLRDGDRAEADDGAARGDGADTAPTRFVWRTDPEGRFSDISQEFTRIVGLRPDEIVGRTFGEIAAQLGLDGDGAIAGLLERRDTWSGRTVLWPIAGSCDAVPVELAALPAYGRDRAFQGFRGFGVVRMGERVRGIAAPPSRPARGKARKRSEQEPVPQPENEVPALTVAPSQGRRASDKVIQLAERRDPPAQSRLSPGERTAFQEIGARLRREFEATERRTETVDTPAARTAPIDRSTTAAEPTQAQQPVPDDTQQPPVTDAPEAAPDGPLAPPIQRDGIMPSAWAGPSDAPLSEAVALIEHLPLAVLVRSGDRLEHANRAWFELTGHDDLAALRDSGGLDELFVGPMPGSQEAKGDDRLRLRRADGREIAVKAHLKSIRWNGRTALMISLREDVQPQAAPDSESQEALAEAERHATELRTIIDTATDGIVLMARDGTIRSISRPAEALFGLDSHAVEGNPFATLFAIESQKIARDYLEGLAQDGVASVLNDGREVIGREAAGGFIPLFMTIGRLPEDGGYCAVLRDITHWKRAEEELTQARGEAERASSQKTEFLARISHEIRTPLNAIIGFSELMMDEKFGPIGSNRYRDYLRDINRSGNHVLDLVNDLLDISKIEAGEQEMNYEAVSLNETLAETIAMMQPQANRERVIIRSSLSSTLPEVVADIRSIRQIALNLLSNALRYTPAGGQVVVSTLLEASGEVLVRIRDTGIGMSLSEIDEALKPFRQINAIKSGRHGGTGLGLPLTKAMVEANRARFVIHSTPGEGTLVEIAFPATRVLVT